jgi:hypothetical protein
MPSAGKSQPSVSIKRQSERVIETYGAVLEDGTVIDLVLPSVSTGLQLLVHDSGRLRVLREFQHRSVSYKPPDLDVSLFRAIEWPRGVGPPSATRNLFSDIFELTQKHISVSTSSARLLSAFVLSTWVSDFLPGIPNIVLAGSASSRLAQIFGLLRNLCRRAAWPAKVNLPTLNSLAPVHPTMLYGGNRISDGVGEILRSPVGSSLFNGTRALDLAFPKVIYLPDFCRGETPALAIEITLEPHDIKPALSREDDREIARAYQPRLLAYRFQFIDRLRRGKTQRQLLRGPEDPLRQSLSSALRLVSKAELTKVLDAVSQQRRFEAAEQLLPLDGYVTEALLLLAHDTQSPGIYVNTVRNVTNKLLADNGEKLNLSARKIGHLMKLLGIRTEKISSEGRGILMLREHDRRIHQLAFHFHLPTLLNSTNHCVLCSKLRTMGEVDETEHHEQSERRELV